MAAQASTKPKVTLSQEIFFGEKPTGVFKPKWEAIAVTNWYALLQKYADCPFMDHTLAGDDDDRMRVESLLDTFVVDHATNQKHFRLLEGYILWNEEQSVYKSFAEKALYQ